MTIDRMTESDLDEVIQIDQESFTAPWSRHMFLNELRGNPFASLFVTRDRERLAGYLCFWIVFEELHLMTLAVSRHYRRQGVATNMVRHAFRFGRERGVKAAMLEVRRSNTLAREFYTRLGFHVVGVRKQYYTNPSEDAMIMRLDGFNGHETAAAATDGSLTTAMENQRR